MAIGKITYPTNPGTPGAPSLTSVAGGALAGATYYAKLTWQTIYGETPAGAEASLAVPANNLLEASPAPTAPLLLIPALGYNIYVSTSSGAETKQNTSGYIPFGATWTEPASGLISGASPSSSWGTTFSFLFPERAVPGFDLRRYGADEISAAGLEMSITQLIDLINSFQMPVVALAGSDLSNWKTFLQTSGLLRVPFDLVTSWGSPQSGAYILTDDRVTAEWTKPGYYRLRLNMRQAQTGSAMAIPAYLSYRIVLVSATDIVPFTVAHGLGRTPIAAIPMMTSGGSIWLQDPVDYDGTNLFLIASAAGVTAKFFVF